MFRDQAETDYLYRLQYCVVMSHELTCCSVRVLWWVLSSRPGSAYVHIQTIVQYCCHAGCPDSHAGYQAGWSAALNFERGILYSPLCEDKMLRASMIGQPKTKHPMVSHV